jgi:allantoicase
MPPRRCAHTNAAEDAALQARFAALTDLADGGLGGRPLFATDEWFATADNLLKSGPPRFDPEAFCEQGKVMDGWETRRRRMPGHDWCVLRLGLPGYIHGFDADTAFFTGNHTPQVRAWDLRGRARAAGLCACLCERTRGGERARGRERECAPLRSA